MFKLQFDTDNAAFEDYGVLEIRRILRKIADEIDGDTISVHAMNIHDINGNLIGKAVYAPDERCDEPDNF